MPMIVLEGPDFAGKSFYAKKLMKYLRKHYRLLESNITKELEIPKKEFNKTIQLIGHHSYIILRELQDSPIIAIRLAVSDIVYSNVFKRNQDLSWINLKRDFPDAKFIHLTTSCFDVIKKRRKNREDYTNEEENFEIYKEYYLAFPKLGIDYLELNNDSFKNTERNIGQIINFVFSEGL